MYSIYILAVEILLDLALHTGVPMILDGIVGTAGETLGNICPTITCAILLEFEDDTIFGLGPGSLGYVGIEMIVPSFSTLLANPS